jgi:hypothetical protein
MLQVEIPDEQLCHRLGRYLAGEERLEYLGRSRLEAGAHGRFLGPPAGKRFFGIHRGGWRCHEINILDVCVLRQAMEVTRRADRN